MSPIPQRIWKCWMPNNFHMRYGKCMSLKDSNLLVGQVWWKEWSYVHVASHQHTDGHHWSTWLSEVQDDCLEPLGTLAWNGIWVYTKPPSPAIKSWYGNLCIRSVITEKCLPPACLIHDMFHQSLRNYLSQFNEAIIRIVPPSQEMFVWAFLNGLK